MPLPTSLLRHLPTLLLLFFVWTAIAAADTIVRLEPLPELTGLPLSPPLGRTIAVAFHPEGDLLVLEDGHQRLLRFDDEGRYVQEAGGFGFDDGSLCGPTDVSAAGFEIWVSDPFAGRIVRFDVWLAPLPPWTGALEEGNEQLFERPVSAVRSSNGDAAVIEADRAELWLLDSRGRLLEQVARFSDHDEGLADPVRVETTPSGGILVADPGRQAVFQFDRFGSLTGKRPWTGPGAGPVTMAAMGDSLWMAGPERLWLLTPAGQPVQAWGEETFGGTVLDLATRGDLLVVATDHGIRRYRVVHLPGQQ